MKASSRIIINTLAQYSKTFLNIIFTLYSTRLILSSLGVEDYGIYTLLAGVVAMLAFITNALSTTTQRFLSYNYGKFSLDVVKRVFNNSLIIHICFGLLLVLFLSMLSPFLFDGFLNIPDLRIGAAKTVYYVVVIILFITFSTSPFRALLIAHENIVFLSIVDVLDGILKVLIAIVLSYISYDKLIAYSIFLGGIKIFNFLAISLFAFNKYSECRNPSISYFDKSYIRELFSFAFWNIYSVGCIVGRTQGIAIVINKFFGAAMNAAYGLGFQIAGYVNFMSESLLNAIKPQIMKSEGAENRERVLFLSELASKYSFFLLSTLAIPCIFEMPTLLALWLKEVPENAVLFSRMVMIAALMDTLTIGLGSANQAIGNIKEYSLVVNTTKLITLPIVCICLAIGLNVTSVAICYIAFEFVCAMIRLPFLHKNGGLDLE